MEVLMMELLKKDQAEVVLWGKQMEEQGEELYGFSLTTFSTME
jgi:hypothetical protein